MSEYTRTLLDYLKRSSPREWHQIAWNWNWDNGVEPLDWITDQPECDKGTALLIYWYGGPRWIKQYGSRDDVPRESRELYDLPEKIERNYLSDFYQSETISFDPTEDFDGRDWTQEYQDIEPVEPIPPEMLEPTKGEKLDWTYLEDGYPVEVIEEIEGPSAL